MQQIQHVTQEAERAARMGSEEKAAEHFAAGLLALEIMHEIRNPLEALGHLTYLTLEDPYDPESVVKYMKMAEEQMATLNRIVGQTLGFARTSLQPKLGDLIDVTEAALRIHQRTITDREICLVTDLPKGVMAEFRMGDMLQVVSNLIANALDALPVSGTISVRLRKRKNTVNILIADNGHGIPACISKSIFEPFFTTKGERGTGLGLALSKKIIERHGGKIRVRSSMVAGKNGTTFMISLPV